MTLPCYQCGKNAVVDGLCPDCFRKEFPLVRVITPIKVTACKRCGSIKIPGGWKTISGSTDDSIELMNTQATLAVGLEVGRLNESVELSIDIINRLDRVLHIDLIAFGKSHEDLTPHEEHHPLEIRFHYATCDTCGMMSGGYHEAILQIRADNREVSEDEMREIMKIVTDMTVSKYGQDSKAFVTEVAENKFGMDLRIGSEHLAKRIADELESRYLAERKDNYKLIGQEKGGKEKFRITILIRLPRFKIGDFVLVNNSPCQITSMSKGGLGCFDLKSRESFTITSKSAKWRSLEFLTELSDSREYMVTMRAFDKPIQVMDAETFEVLEIDQSKFDSSASVGQNVKGIILEEVFYLLPDASQ
ncbi:MAG: hypothetical protein BAJATHORv1_20185 [Candidatus Thorarchaeota archaeon]|nr:MAG: hypothetical protein BAJATHORv1_20185 [Candidatus Thorarchaeota archaeon]